MYISNLACVLRDVEQSADSARCRDRYCGTLTTEQTANVDQSLLLFVQARTNHKIHVRIALSHSPPQLLKEVWPIVLHWGAKLSKPEPNHANRILGQIPTRNSLRGFNRRKENYLKVNERTGIRNILPYYRVRGPNFNFAKGLDWPEIDLHTIGLDRILGVLLLISA